MLEEHLLGSIVACLYAMGYKADEMYDIFKKYCKKIKYVDIGNIFKLILGLICTGQICIDGLNSGKQIEDLINKIGKAKGIYNISDIKKALVIPSVNLCNGELICFTSCKFRKTISNAISDEIIFVNDAIIGEAVRASCSYPVVFSPCNYKNVKLIDGGIRENVPWKELKMIGADKVLSIMFDETEVKDCDKNLVEVAESSINLLCHELSNYEMEGADYVLKIKSGKVGLLDMKKIDMLYELGYKETKRHIKLVKKLEE
jgi:NTE family protein